MREDHQEREMKYFIHKAELDRRTSKCGGRVASRLSKVVVQVANAIKVVDIKTKESVDKVIKMIIFSIPPILLSVRFFKVHIEPALFYILF